MSNLAQDKEKKAIRLRVLAGFLLLIWATVLLAVFFVFQKPTALQVLDGLVSLALTLVLTAVLFLEAAGMGGLLLGALAVDPQERLLLGAGLGLGLFGLAGFGLAVSGLAKPVVLGVLLLLVFVWQAVKGILRATWRDSLELFSALKAARQGGSFWMPLAASAAFLLTFMLALAPPADGFDSLLYHLTTPALWLADGGLKLVDIPHYWFPALMEGLFVWPLAFGSDTAPQLLHLGFGCLTALLLWKWAGVLSSPRTGWLALMLFLSVPAVLWLATWAYTDLALAFFGLGALYALWKWEGSAEPGWVYVMAAFSGLAMGVKYTSFVVPLFTGGFLLIKVLRKGTALAQKGRIAGLFARFCGIALLVASPWYLRNWVWMRNPFYPFVFGGPFWDAFRANWYASSGTGLGLNVPELLLLPFSVTFGVHEVSNFLDSQIGPFFLILLPVVAWTLWKARSSAPANARLALMILAGFSVFSAVIWTYGVVVSASLWQGRLLIPGILPLIVPMALALEQIGSLDVPRVKISFVFSFLLFFFVILTLVDFGLLVFHRNPLMAALGVEKRQAYLERIQPPYAAALDLVAQTPPDAHIYLLFEPRSYGMARPVFPDPINDHLAHDFFLYGGAEAVLNAWRERGFTHVLLFAPGLEGLRTSTHVLDASFWTEEARLFGRLERLAQSQDGNYILYTIPPQ